MQRNEVLSIHVGNQLLELFKVENIFVAFKVLRGKKESKINSCARLFCKQWMEYLMIGGIDSNELTQMCYLVMNFWFSTMIGLSFDFLRNFCCIVSDWID